MDKRSFMMAQAKSVDHHSSLSSSRPETQIFYYDHNTSEEQEQTNSANEIMEKRELSHLENGKHDLKVDPDDVLEGRGQFHSQDALNAHLEQGVSDDEEEDVANAVKMKVLRPESYDNDGAQVKEEGFDLENLL